jgi:acyl-coenzyme A thioesterase PaaI-like protein
MDTPMTDLTRLPQKSCALRVVPQPSDANVHGDVFGGWIMAQVDIAGSIPASRRANGRVATIAVNSFVFKQPVFVGDLLSFYADIVKTGVRAADESRRGSGEGHRSHAHLCRDRQRPPAARIAGARLMD